MSTKTNLNKSAIKSLRKGIDEVYNAVAPTLGACGRNAMYRSAYSRSPMSTNDGVSIARMVNPDNEAEALGADAIKQAASRTNDEAGDATTTTVVLSKKMVDKSFKIIARGKNPMTLRKEIQDASAKVIQRIKEVTKQIESDEDIFNIANTSMENPEVAKIVADAVRKVGENGRVIVEESNNLVIEQEDVEGLKFDSGLLMPFMVNKPSTMECVLENVLVLVTDKQMSINQDIIGLWNNIAARGIKQLLVISDAVTGELLQTIYKNTAQGIFNMVVVTKPTDEEVMSDIVTFTGAEYLSREKVAGAFKEEHFKSLGKCKKVIIGEKSALLIGGSGDEVKVKERIDLIKEKINTSTGYLKEKTQERLANLVGKTVILKVGAPTEAEMRYLKLKIDDAVGSAKSSIEEGIVIGGGKALYEIGSTKPTTDGEKVVYFACRQPLIQILKNAGFWWLKRWFIIRKLKQGEIYNVITNKVVTDPISYGLTDATKAERCSIKNSASFASTLITTHCSIIDIVK